MTQSSAGDELKGRRALITGGLGFIGSNLARRLVADGVEVTLVDSLVPEYGGNMFNIAGIEDRVIVNISDIRDRYSLAHLVRGKDLLFNLAGQTSHMDAMADPYTDLEINCRAQLSILETCREVNPEIKTIFASTRQLYGQPQYLPVDECHPLRPVDVNAINKLAGEQYHILYHNIYGIRTTVFRLTNTYGPRMRIKDSRQAFLGIWIRCVTEGIPFEVWGGDQLRDLTYVDDVVEAMVLAATSDSADGQIFNLGGEGSIDLRSLADLLVDLSGSGKYEVREYPRERIAIDIGDYYADFSLAESTLGWTPRIPLAEGLMRTLNFYREHLPHYI
jgi:nucleoside-diphosphate-sugar epimerase